jgi:hypothetical protein
MIGEGCGSCGLLPWAIAWVFNLIISRQAIEVSAPAGDPLQELFEEIDALNRKRTYKQVPNEPARSQRLGPVARCAALTQLPMRHRWSTP